MTSKTKNYFTIVYEDGAVRKLSTSEDVSLPQNVDVKYIIFSKYSHSSAKGFENYFIHQIFDEENNPLVDNTFEWNGVKCRLHAKEHWGNIDSIWVVLRADIWDKLDNLKTKTFENGHHNGFGFSELFSYIHLLSAFATHDAYDLADKIVKSKDAEIANLKSLIDKGENR